MLRIVIALILIGHGVGHGMRLLGVSNVASVYPAWHGDSWILSGVAGGE